LAVAAWAAVFLLAQPASLRGSYTTLVQNGPASNRVNIVFLGDGYTADQIDTEYVQHIDAILSHFFDAGQDPFPRYRNFFNVYCVNVVSNESGADALPLGILRDTALDASYFYMGGPERLLYVDEDKAWAALNNGLAGSGITPNIRLVTVNDTRYGGGGGAFTVFAGGNANAGELALHETGHSFSDLADEYGDGSSTYPGPEPSEVNITKDPCGTKWNQWLGYVDSLGTVGAYEGAGYYQYGLYRPTSTSKMRALGKPFNAVCREKIVQDIYGIVDPLDDYLHAAGTLVDPNSLWVDTVDPNVIQVAWYVDDVLVTAAAGETFRLSDYGYGAGMYDVVARAFDSTDWVRSGLDALEQTVEWEVELTPEPASLLLVVAGAALIILRRRAQPAVTATQPRISPATGRSSAESGRRGPRPRA
jgi:hypothetical protein